MVGNNPVYKVYLALYEQGWVYSKFIPQHDNKPKRTMYN